MKWEDMKQKNRNGDVCERNLFTVSTKQTSANTKQLQRVCMCEPTAAYCQTAPLGTENQMQNTLENLTTKPPNKVPVKLLLGK